MNKLNKKENYDSFDLLKFICSLLIVCLHINPFSHDGATWLFSRAIAGIGVPIFFMLSGFFLFSKIFADEKHRKLIVQQSLHRLVTLLLAWLIPYFFVIDIWWITKGNLRENLLKYVQHIMFGGEGFYLWYIVALIVATLMCFMVFDWKLKYSMGLALVLLIIGMIGLAYPSILEKATMLQSLHVKYMLFFTTYRNGVFFGFPCVYVGMLLAKFKMRLPDLQKSVGIFLCCGGIFAC